MEDALEFCLATLVVFKSSLRKFIAEHVSSLVFVLWFVSISF